MYRVIYGYDVPPYDVSSLANGELAQLEQVAALINAGWQPALAEMLYGDEIYFNGAPDMLLVVGNEFDV